jgi:hypothetical protein
MTSHVVSDEIALEIQIQYEEKVERESGRYKFYNSHLLFISSPSQLCFCNSNFQTTYCFESLQRRVAKHT